VSTLIFHLPPDLTTALLRTVYAIKEVRSQGSGASSDSGDMDMTIYCKVEIITEM
jgi:hypothetical protein